MNPDPWWERAACRGLNVNLFVTNDRPTPSRIEAALEVCRRCAVVGPCRREAESIPGTVGVWGGRVYGIRPARRSGPLPPVKITPQI